MKINVASSRARVFVINVATRLFTRIFSGAMLVLVVFLALGLADTSCHASSARGSHSRKKVKVWKFIQRNTHGIGVLIFNQSAIKYTFLDQNVSWVSSAPTWNLCIFNPKVNRGTLRPLSYCIGRGNNKVDYGITRDTSKSKRLFQNRPAIKVTYRVSSADPVKEKVEMMYQSGSERSSSFSGGERLFSDWIKIAPQVQYVLNGLTRVSTTKGVMLEEIHLYPGGRRHRVLSTDSFTQCEVSASEFDYPTGFTESTIKDIMQEKEKAREMSGVFEELLFDPAPTKKSSGSTAPRP